MATVSISPSTDEFQGPEKIFRSTRNVQISQMRGVNKILCGGANVSFGTCGGMTAIECLSEEKNTE